jgi:predicted acyl esterase
VGSDSFSALAGEGSAEFVSEPFEEETVLRGLPELDLVASVTGQVVHLVTTLWVEESDGTRRAANYCATNTHLRNDVRTPAVVVPGSRWTSRCSASPRRTP